MFVPVRLGPLLRESATKNSQTLINSEIGAFANAENWPNPPTNC